MNPVSLQAHLREIGVPPYGVGSQRYSSSLFWFEFRRKQDGSRLKDTVKAAQVSVLLLKLKNSGSSARSSFCISTGFRIGFFNPVPKHLWMDPQ